MKVKVGDILKFKEDVFQTTHKHLNGTMADCVDIDENGFYEFQTIDKGNLFIKKEFLSTYFVDEYQPKHAKEMVNHPDHYQIHKHECIEEMIAVFGIEDVKTFCKLNIWKYRYRSSAKNGEEDLKKADEYMDILMELQRR